MNDDEKQAVFCIADMSGYTRFIFSNEKEISHSQMVIRELITTLVNEVSLPLRLLRIEGDAIFLYAVNDELDRPGRPFVKTSSPICSLFSGYSPTNSPS